jgi:hypothetical protein
LAISKWFRMYKQINKLYKLIKIIKKIYRNNFQLKEIVVEIPIPSVTFLSIIYYLFFISINLLKYLSFLNKKYFIS